MTIVNTALRRANEKIRVTDEAYTQACIENHDLLQSLIVAWEITTCPETKAYLDIVLKEFEVTEH